MAKISSGTGLAGLWPFVGINQNPNQVSLHPRRLLATVVGAFFVVALTAWTLAFLQRSAFAVTLDNQKSEPVAFQPSQLVRSQMTNGYLGR